MRNTIIEIEDPSGAKICLVENIPHRWHKELAIKSKDPGSRYMTHAKINNPSLQAVTVSKMRILAQEFPDALGNAPLNDRIYYFPSTVPGDTCMDGGFKIINEGGVKSIVLFGVKIQDPETVLNSLATALDSIN